MKNLVCDLSVASSSLSLSFVFFSFVSLSTVSLYVEKKLAIDLVVEANRLLLQDTIVNIHEQPMSTFDAAALNRGYIVSRLLAVMMLIIPPGLIDRMCVLFVLLFGSVLYRKTLLN